MNREVILKKAIPIICEVSGCLEAEVTPDSTLNYDLGIDSLDRIGMVMKLEREFLIEISDESMDSFKTVGEVVSYIESAVNPVSC